MGQSKSKQGGIPRAATIHDIFESWPFIKRYEVTALSCDDAIDQLSEKCKAMGLPSFKPIPGKDHPHYYCGMWKENMYNTVFVGLPPCSMDELELYEAFVYFPSINKEKKIQFV